MKIYLASGNKNKKREMSEIFSGHTIVTPQDEGIDFAPEETGNTFYENSLIKARDLYSKVHTAVIADDSGICVDALGGIPGVYSSRYAGAKWSQGNPLGEKIPQYEQNRLLLEQLNAALKAFPDKKRTAHYVCAMVLYFGNDKLFVAQETMEGTLVNSIDESRGDGGFGYDPIFIPLGYEVTAAELTPEQKNAISHRGKAARILQKIAQGIL